MENSRKQHPILKHLAKAALALPQLADVVHELGQKHRLFYAASGHPVRNVA